MGFVCGLLLLFYVVCVVVALRYMTNGSVKDGLWACKSSSFTP